MPRPAILALEPSDFVLYALLAVVALYLVPRHLLHYWGRTAPGAAGRGGAPGSGAVRRSARQATRRRRVD
jgi:hypothetical protein